MTGIGLPTGTPIVLYLHSPREKIWGLLVGGGAAGVIVRGIDLAAFDDWLRQEARGEDRLIGLVTGFYPLGRLERFEVDESVGPVRSLAQRVELATGRPVASVVGLRGQRSSTRSKARGPTGARKAGTKR
jgi:hypothetical protein